MRQPSQEEILALSSEVALACDAQGRVRWLDPRAARLFGPELDRPFDSLVALGTEDKALRFLQEASAGQTDSWELVLLVNGCPVASLWRGAPMEGGAVLVGSLAPEAFQASQQRVAEILMDLARRERESEQHRRQAQTEQRRLQQVVDQLPEAILISDAQGRFAMANAAAVSLLGPQLIAQPSSAADLAAFGARRLDGTPLAAEQLPLHRSAASGEIVLGEQVLVRDPRSARDIPLLVNSAPLYDVSGQPAGAVAVFQDITAIKDLERHKDEFLATVSHDLKNPLAGIKGWIQLLNRRAAKLPETAGLERWQQDLTTVETIATRMARMLDELLDATHLQMGRPLELHRQPTDLVALAHRVAEDSRQLTDAHTIHVRSDESEVVGWWDATRLERVIGNLVSNAVKYSPEGGEVCIHVAREHRDREVAVLSVSDQGIGIPPEELPRVFERFYRATNVTGQIAGTGIGLAGARHLVEQHEGEIDVRSTPGQGSTFTVRLPLALPTA